MQAKLSGSFPLITTPVSQGVRKTTQPSTTAASSLNERIQQTSQQILGQIQGRTSQNNPSLAKGQPYLILSQQEKRDDCATTCT